MTKFTYREDKEVLQYLEKKKKKDYKGFKKDAWIREATRTKMEHEK